MNSRNALLSMGAVALVGGVIVAGCAISVGQQQPPKPQPGQPQGQKPAGQPNPGQPGAGAAKGGPPPPRKKPLAGVPIRAVSDPAVVAKMIPRGPFVARRDPFALLPIEAAFDKYAAAIVRARSAPSFPMYYRAVPERVEVTPVEQQPYRRLAAILIGESVSALIDMGDGRGMIRIRPGQRIPGSEWIVDSIDNEKAVLRRIPESKKRPTEVIVRLESPPRGLGGGITPPGGAPGGQGAPPPRGGRTGGRQGAGAGGGGSID